MDEIEQITKQKNEVLKRIQERQRLMELIQNKNLKQNVLIKFRMHFEDIEK